MPLIAAIFSSTKHFFLSTEHMTPTIRPQLNDAALIHEHAFIQNKWVQTAERFAVYNPATAALIAEVANLDVSNAHDAIQAAQTALPGWSALTGKDRANILRKWFDLIVVNADDLAAIMTAEQGKPLAEAKGEVLYGASFVEWFAEEAKRVSGDVLSSTWADKRTMVLKQPIGVCAAITPWNFPLAMITRKVAPALAAGCTIVIKPAEQTPLCALALADLAMRAGMPAGVLNVLTADAEQSVAIGRVLCGSSVVRHLSFTGSTPVGRILMQQCAPSLKKLALELGGHAPFIVFEDADLDAAVEGALQSKFRNAGQTCVCTNRFYVHSSLYEEFLTKFSLASRKVVVGNGTELGVRQGPLIDQQAIDKVQSHVTDAIAQGARLIVGGKKHEKGGLFFEPTILADVSHQMLVMREETFGPVAAVMRFDHEDEVIAAANNTDFGLAAYFYARDIARVWRVAERLEYGMVGVNTGLIANEVTPFGGVKQSGLGREGSKYGMDEYLEMKYVCLGGM